MDFWAYLIESLVKMALLVAVSICGIFFGKFLREKKDAKQNMKKTEP